MTRPPIILVSLCLTGEKCLYHGGSCSFALDILGRLREAECQLITVCPEVLGGMTIPRAPSLWRGSRLYARGNLEKDVTAYFERGRDLALEMLHELEELPDVALLLNNSPACDPLRGVFGRALSALGIYCVAAERGNAWAQVLLGFLEGQGFTLPKPIPPKAKPSQLRLL